MAIWRTKAYEMFGFSTGSYSFKWGMVALFADLREMARQSARCGDSQLLDRIFEYVLWVETQNAENLKSAADIEFFMPVCRDEVLYREAILRLPADLLARIRSQNSEDG
jgi:hypothetical protein